LVATVVVVMVVVVVVVVVGLPCHYQRVQLQQ
jgi:hypothetical protein